MLHWEKSQHAQEPAFAQSDQTSFSANQALWGIKINLCKSIGRYYVCFSLSLGYNQKPLLCWFCVMHLKVLLEKIKPREVRGVLFCERVFWGLRLLIQWNKVVLAPFFSCKDPLGISLAIPAPEKGSSFANHLVLFGSETHSEDPCVH